MMAPAMALQKRQALLDLGRQRQRTRWDGYGCIGDYHDGAYESDWVSPYSKTAGNVDSRILVLLQDWASHDFLSQPVDDEVAKLGHRPSLQTNKNLRRLLEETCDVELKDVFGTNLLPFVKPGGMSAPIPMRDLVRAAHEFALPQIRVVQPAIVICLGLATFNAIRRGCGETPATTIAQAIDSPFSAEGPTVWCQAHTGPLGQNNRNRGGVDRVSADWLRMNMKQASTEARLAKHSGHRVKVMAGRKGR
jgi:hypothetical protein